MKIRERIGVTIENGVVTSVAMNKETARWVIAYTEGFKESIRHCSRLQNVPKNFKKSLGKSIANTYTNCSSEITDFEHFLHGVAESVEILTGERIV